MSAVPALDSATMKREAEKQLSKDDRDEDEDELQEISSGHGFKKADESVLATRTIKSLPRRSAAGSPGATPPPSTLGTSSELPSIPSSKFTGFGGSSTKIPSDFSFTPPLNLGNGPSSPSPSSSPAIPSVAPSASNATKAFASFLGPPSQSSPTAQSPSPSRTTSSSISVDQPASKYYTSLRGLNHSILTAITKAIDQDPFADVANMLEQYKALRLDMQKDFDKSLNGSKSAPPTTTPLAPPPPPSKPFMFGNSTIPNSNASTSVVGGGFVPKMDVPPTASPPIVPSEQLFQKDTLAPTPSPSIFGTLSGTSSPATSPGFSFGAPPTGSDKPKPFITSADTTSHPQTDTTTSDTPKSAFSGFGAKVSEDLTPPSERPSFFGAKPDFSAKTPAFGSGFSASGPNPFTLSKDAQSTTSNTGFTGFGSFKKLGGSIGNPVGFGFGSTTKSDTDSVSTEKPTSTPSSGFAFGSASSFGSGSGFGSGSSFGSSAFGSSSFSPTEKKSADKEEKKDENTDEGSINGEENQRQKEEGGSTLLVANPHDEEGEGEEDEDTTFSIKVKAFKLKKNEATGTSSWAELGIGFLRLKKHKKSDGRRVLLRNSSTGKININFNIYTGLKPSLVGKAITLIGHDNGIPQTFTLRLQNEEQAKELKSALDKEIAFVSTKLE